MHLFLITSDNPESAHDPEMSWLVVATDKDEAQELLPSEATVREVQNLGHFDGPKRVLGWSGSVIQIGPR